MLTEKDYCDYDTCVALQELGYEEGTDLRYRYGRLGDFLSGVKAPTLYEAQTWLRKNKQIHISITLYMEGYAATIKHFYVFEGEFAWKEPIILQCRKSQEEALSEGIKEAVKLLKEEK